jgi:hypothetical protein
MQTAFDSIKEVEETVGRSAAAIEDRKNAVLITFARDQAAPGIALTGDIHVRLSK